MPIGYRLAKPGMERTPRAGIRLWKEEQLEEELQRKLDFPGTVGCARDHSKARSSQCGAGTTQSYVVEGVKELSAKLNVGILARKRKILKDT